MSPQDKAREIDAALDAKARKDAEENKKEEFRKMDAENGETLNKVLSCLDSISKRMDSYEAKLDAARQDGAEAAMVDRRKKDAVEEKGEAEKLPFRKDGEKEMEEEGDPRPLKADSRSDSLPRTISDSERDLVAQIQSDAERVCSAWGNSADRPMMNERADEYRRRTARKHQQHSGMWKECNLRELSGVALKNATDQIFKDSFEMAS